jgi:hypothetical protein
VTLNTIATSGKIECKSWMDLYESKKFVSKEKFIKGRSTNKWLNLALKVNFLTSKYLSLDFAWYSLSSS